MGEPWFPDPARSRAVLIGVGRYRSPELPAIPAVRNNIHDLHDVLTDPVRGTLPADGCVRLGDDTDQARVGTAVATAADQARDLLLVYYAGHGVLDRDGKLHLALRNSDPDHLAWTAIPNDLLKRELARSRAKARVLILDCCFSGRAVEAMSATSSLVAGQLTVTGTYTLTSTTATDPAHAPLGDRHTAFTGALLRALRGPTPLTLDDLYRHTEDELAGLGLPRPQRRSVNTANDVALVRVPPPPPAPKPPPPSPPPRREQPPAPKPNPPKASRPTELPKPSPANRIPAARILSEPTPITPTTPGPRHRRQDVNHDPSFTLPNPEWPPSRWPIPKAIASLVFSAVFGIVSWNIFLDPWRNADPNGFEIGVAIVFGIAFAVAAVAILISALNYLRQAFRRPRNRQNPR